MDYRLACAMRGPDLGGADADAWKFFVTQKLRWFAARELGEEPSSWCKGYVSAPSEGVLNDAESLALAQTFAEKLDSFHVAAHARDAFDWLEDYGKEVPGMSAREYYYLLINHKVL